jgi:hypothetical protein
VRDLPLSPEAAAPDWEAFYTSVAQVQLEADQLEQQIQSSLDSIVQKQAQLLKAGTLENAQLSILKQQRQQLLALQYQLNGNQSKKARAEFTLPGIQERLRRIFRAQWSSNQITQTSRDNFAIAQALLAEAQAAYRLILP